MLILLSAIYLPGALESAMVCMPLKLRRALSSLQLRGAANVQCSWRITPSRQHTLGAPLMC